MTGNEANLTQFIVSSAKRCIYPCPEPLNRHGELPEMRFEFLFNLTGKWTIAFLQILIFKRPIMAGNQSLVKRWRHEVKLGPRFRKSLDFQISSLLGSFKKTNAFLVYLIRSNETVHDKWRLHKSVRQTESGLKRGFVKHWLNFV